jgi:hypothetical protein
LSENVRSLLEQPLQLSYIADDIYRLKTALEINYYGSVQPVRYNVLTAPDIATLFEPGTRLWGLPAYQFPDETLPPGKWQVQAVIAVAGP